MRTGSKSTYVLLVAVLLVSLPACRRDPLVLPVSDTEHTGTLRVTVVPEWEGTPLVFFTEYRNVEDLRTTVESLKFYWGDVQLFNGLRTSGMTAIDLFDLQNGPVTKEWKVGVGAWTGLRAGLGVPYGLNHTDPALYAADEPLSVDNLMFWTWTDGYKFVLFEGRFDPDPSSGGGAYPGAYSIHTGLDTCYMTMDLYRVLPIKIVQDSITELTVRVAVDRFFHSSTDSIHLATEYASHGNNLPLALKFTRNMTHSFSIE